MVNKYSVYAKRKYKQIIITAKAMMQTVALMTADGPSFLVNTGRSFSPASPFPDSLI